MILYDIVYLCSNVFTPYITKNFYDLFLAQDREKKKLSTIAYVIYYILTSAIYLLFEIPILTVATNIVCLVMITFCYEGKISKKIFTVFYTYGYGFVIELLAVFLTGKLTVNFFEKTEYTNCVALLLSKSLACIFMFMFKNIFRKKYKFTPPAHILCGFILIPLSTIVIEIMIVAIPDITQKTLVSCTIIFLLVNMAFFFMFDYLTALYNKKYNDEITFQEKEYYYNQCMIMKNSVNEIKNIRHDLKNHYSTLHEFLYQNEREKAMEYIKTLTDITEKKLRPYSISGNIAIDSIINYKLCSKPENIKVTIENTIPSELPIQISDLTVILTNLLDNAICAVENLKSEKIIDIKIKFEKNLLMVMIKNTYDGIINYKNGKIVTTKDDDDTHGRGLDLIRETAEKYNGVFTTSHDDNYFTSEVFLYLEAKPQKADVVMVK